MFWWPLTSTATGQLILNWKCYQVFNPEMTLHMINIIYAALPMRAETEKTTSGKLYIYIGVGARDLNIDKTHMALDIFCFVVFFIWNVNFRVFCRKFFHCFKPFLVNFDEISMWNQVSIYSIVIFQFVKSSYFNKRFERFCFLLLVLIRQYTVVQLAKLQDFKQCWNSQDGPSVAIICL